MNICIYIYNILYNDIVIIYSCVTFCRASMPPAKLPTTLKHQGTLWRCLNGKLILRKVKPCGSHVIYMRMSENGDFMVIYW